MAQSSRRRPGGRPYPKGKSGNPGGLTKEKREIHRALSAYALERVRDGMLLVDRLIDVVEGRLVITEQRVVVEAAGGNCGSEARVIEIDVAPTHRDVLRAIEQLREIALGATLKPEALSALHERAEVESPTRGALRALPPTQLTRLIDVLAGLPDAAAANTDD